MSAATARALILAGAAEAVDGIDARTRATQAEQRQARARFASLFENR